MRRFVVLFIAVVSMLALIQPVSAMPSSSPSWLQPKIEQTARLWFGNAKPVRIDTIDSPREIAVVYSLARPVHCGKCPELEFPNPRVQFVRTTFNKQTHARTTELTICHSRRICLFH